MSALPTILADLATKVAIGELLHREVLPRVDGELACWYRRAHEIPDLELRAQALHSLRDKRFHAEGGSVFAALAPAWMEVLVPLIVALQTISNYLDNLCDRGETRDGADFRRLHQAMLDAVDPGGGTADYYAFHPRSADGGYLAALVEACQRRVRLLPAYAAVRGQVKRFIALYNDLQVYKHLDPASREAALRRWFSRHRRSAPGLAWWEFAAAAGSTLGVFALLAAATDQGLGAAEVRSLAAAYFPWVCGLHILLDYFIDQAEDRSWGDLNFVAYYPTPTHAARRATGSAPSGTRPATP